MATNNVINAPLPLVVSQGGTGSTNHVAYSVLCGGTGTTTALQSVASVGTSGNVLTSNGPSALPSFQAGGVTGSGAWRLLDVQTISSAATASFITGLSSTYSQYVMMLDSLTLSNTASFFLKLSNDGGGTYISTGYTAGSNASNTFAVNTSSTTNGVLSSSISSGSALFCKATIYFYGPGNAIGTNWYGNFVRFQSGSQLISYFGGFLPTVSINGIQIGVSAGTYSGIISLYGIIK